MIIMHASHEQGCDSSLLCTTNLLINSISSHRPISGRRTFLGDLQMDDHQITINPLVFHLDLYQYPSCLYIKAIFYLHPYLLAFYI